MTAAASKDVPKKRRKFGGNEFNKTSKVNVIEGDVTFVTCTDVLTQPEHKNRA